MNATTTTAKTSRSKKVLIPLATLLAAGAIAVGSGATFSSETGNTMSAVTSGTLTQTNSKDNAAIFNLPNMKPGDVVNGSLSIKNTGTLPADFTLTEVLSANEFAGENLKLVIKNTTAGTTKAPVVYTGTFGGLTDGAANALGTFAAGEKNDYTFTVSLAESANNTQQGKTASASFKWNSVQLVGETANQ